jgi:hypothetical protein
VTGRPASRSSTVTVTSVRDMGPGARRRPGRTDCTTVTASHRLCAGTISGWRRPGPGAKPTGLPGRRHLLIKSVIITPFAVRMPCTIERLLLRVIICCIPEARCLFMGTTSLTCELTDPISRELIQNPLVSDFITNKRNITQKWCNSSLSLHRLVKTNKSLTLAPIQMSQVRPAILNFFYDIAHTENCHFLEI